MALSPDRLWEDEGNYKLTLTIYATRLKWSNPNQEDRSRIMEPGKERVLQKPCLFKGER